jgi:hypothetical protein
MDPAPSRLTSGASPRPVGPVSRTVSCRTVRCPANPDSSVRRIHSDRTLCACPGRPSASIPPYSWSSACYRPPRLTCRSAFRRPDGRSAGTHSGSDRWPADHRAHAARDVQLGPRRLALFFAAGHLVLHANADAISWTASAVELQKIERIVPAPDGVPGIVSCGPASFTSAKKRRMPRLRRGCERSGRANPA